MSLVAIVLLGVIAGGLIGSIGIGGVIVPPALVFAMGFDPHLAAGTSSWSFLFTGIVGSIVYSRRAVMPWRMVGYLTLGIVPAALAGAFVNAAIPDAVAMLPLAALTLGAGLFQLCARSGTQSGGLRQFPAWSLICIGVAVGFCSSLTGTGGPVVLMPILLTLGVPVALAVAAAQVIQIPLVLFATAGYAAHGQVAFGLGTLLGIAAAAGVLVGVWFAMRQPERRLRLFAGAAMLVIGAALLISSFA
ncbi:sulfite exporter TauE/SafE family protein [Cumulibacter soli]|uniref:sulfite exporter TauE/SafE family protein n=1 Tax=Cumulibacter soli TaxID=2546344 RepID=UPI001419B38F|nr:sulfite exporter TauE/SafE family protein [Cumulibacter soli]